MVVRGRTATASLGDVRWVGGAPLPGGRGPHQSRLSSSPAQQVSLAPSMVWRGQGRSFRCPEKAQNEGARDCPHGLCPGQSVWTPFCFHDLTGSRRLGRPLRVQPGHGDDLPRFGSQELCQAVSFWVGTLGSGTGRRWASGSPAHTHQQSLIQLRGRWSFWETVSLEDLRPGCT